ARRASGFFGESRSLSKPRSRAAAGMASPLFLAVAILIVCCLLSSRLAIPRRGTPSAVRPTLHAFPSSPRFVAVFWWHWQFIDLVNDQFLLPIAQIGPVILVKAWGFFQISLCRIEGDLFPILTPLQGVPGNRKVFVANSRKA